MPAVLTPVYEHHVRYVDTSGYVNLETNRYSVPERYIGKTLDVYKYPDEVRIMNKQHSIATHPRLLGVRHGRNKLAGHHIPLPRRKHEPSQAEQQLLGEDNVLDQYVQQLKKHVRGRGARQLQRLLGFKQIYPNDAFYTAIGKALQFGLFDLGRVENMIIKTVAGVYFNMHEGDEK